MMILRERQTLLGALVGASFVLSACGFQPLYSERATGPAVHAELSAIDVDVKGDALSRTVFSDLLDELTPTGAPAKPTYRLEVKLSRIKKGVGFEEDDSVTRFNFQLIGEYRLVDTGTKAVVFSSTSRSIAAYNVVSNQYATLTAEKDAEKRASADLAHDIRLQLSLHFRQFQ